MSVIITIINAIMLSCWFEGTVRLFAYLFPYKTTSSLYVGILLTTISLLYFYLNDGKLTEIYNRTFTKNNTYYSSFSSSNNQHIQ